jgi:hypothetical protein
MKGRMYETTVYIYSTVHVPYCTVHHLIDVSHDLGVSTLVSSVLSVQDSLTGSVHLDLSDDNIGSRDGPLEGLSILLVVSASLDMNDVFLSVACKDLALGLVESSADHHDLIVLSHGKRTHL